MEKHTTFLKLMQLGNNTSVSAGMTGLFEVCDIRGILSISIFISSSLKPDSEKQFKIIRYNYFYRMWLV